MIGSKAILARERRQDTSQRILDAAAGLVGQRGYFGFSIKELGELCGLSVPGILHHYPSKDQLLIGLLQSRDEQDEREIIALLPADWDSGREPTMAETRRIFRNIVERNAGQPELVRLYSMLRTEALYPEHPAYAFFEQRDARTLYIFQRIVGPNAVDGRGAARRLFAMMGGLEELWLRTPTSVDLVAEWDAAVALLLPTAIESSMHPS